MPTCTPTVSTKFRQMRAYVRPYWNQIVYKEYSEYVELPQEVQTRLHVSRYFLVCSQNKRGTYRVAHEMS